MTRLALFERLGVLRPAGLLVAPLVLLASLSSVSSDGTRKQNLRLARKGAKKTQTEKLHAEHEAILHHHHQLTRAPCRAAESPLGRYASALPSPRPDDACVWPLP